MELVYTFMKKIQNGSLSITKKKKNKNSSDIVELVKILDALQRKESSLDEALEFIQKVTYADRVLLVLLSPIDGDIYIEASAGLSSEQKEQGHYVLGEGVVGKVIESGKAMFVEDVMHNPIFLNRTSARKDVENISFLCVPIKSNDKVIGALGLDRPTEKVIDPKHEERLVSVIANFFLPYISSYQNSIQKRNEEPVRLPKAKSRLPRYLVGNSECMQLIYQRIEQVATSPTTVMLRGESGTGKELVARAIHEASSRKKAPFITLNCAAIPENLVESELFGHEKGAFTNAVQSRAGRFEMAHTGTLFLDEVGELSLATQARLLRVLQERTFERVGGTQTHKVDVRIITATNRTLESMVAEGDFRKDLYYRLNVFCLSLPPLNQRLGDIIILAEHFLEQFAKINNREKPKISMAAQEMLEKYSWPGNIRELENTIERALLLMGKGAYLLPQHLPIELHSASCPECGANHSDTENLYMRSFASLPERIEELERASIIDALIQHKGHMGLAANYLGITERIMGQRMRKYAILYKDYRVIA